MPHRHTFSGVVANLEPGERSGVWGQSPQRDPGAEPLVRGSGGQSPLEAESFFVFGYPEVGAIFHLYCILYNNVGLTS